MLTSLVESWKLLASYLFFQDCVTQTHGWSGVHWEITLLKLRFWFQWTVAILKWWCMYTVLQGVLLASSCSVRFHKGSQKWWTACWALSPITLSYFCFVKWDLENKIDNYLNWSFCLLFILVLQWHRSDSKDMTK